MPTDTVIADSWHNSGVFTTRNGRYVRNYKALDRQYEPWKSAHKEISEYIAVGKGRFIDRGELPNQKSRAASKVINPTAPDALHMLGAGLHGGLSSPARPWFQLKFVDEVMNKFKSYREWLDECEKVMYSAFKSSAFYTIIHSVYEEIGAFSIGSLLMDERIKDGIPDGFMFYENTAGDYRVSVGSDKLTKQWYRKYRQQACAVVSDFSEENVSDKVKNLLRTNPYEWVDIIHVIEPNPDYNPDKIDSQPVVSIYFEAKESDKRLSEKGYNEMPVVTPRWSALSNEAYGWGPGLDGLGLAKAIQRQEVQSFMASDKAIEPPMGVPPSMKDRMVDLSAGAKNVYDPAEGKIERLVDIDINALAYFDNKILANEERIRRIFFNELFLMIANEHKQMTATEILSRNEEKMLMIGPTIERLEYELLDPLVSRGFNILGRQGKLPPAPPDLDQAEYRIEYVSILAQAQKLINSQSLQGYLTMAERVAAVEPASVDKTNWDEFLAEAGNTVSLSAKLINSEDEVAAIRQARADQQEQLAQMEQQQAETQNLKTLSETKTAGDSNVLADVQSELGG